MKVSPLTASAKMHVHVYDYARVSPRVLEKAEGRLQMVLAQAGVVVSWENFIPPNDPAQGSPVRPHPSDAVGVDLSIVRHFETVSGLLRYNAMGFAVPPDTATLSFEWVQELSSLGIAEEYQILGAAMGHEIGHLFLGPNSHSPLGIMRAGWQKDDLKAASQSRLNFTADQALRIRAEIERRREQQAAQAAALPPVRLPAAPTAELGSPLPRPMLTIRDYNYAKSHGWMR